MSTSPGDIQWRRKGDHKLDTALDFNIHAGSGCPFIVELLRNLALSQFLLLLSVMGEGDQIRQLLSAYSFLFLRYL